jgi:hypothetical protein
MICAGVFGTTVNAYGDSMYMTWVIAVLTLLGLCCCVKASNTWWPND